MPTRRTTSGACARPAPAPLAVPQIPRPGDRAAAYPPGEHPAPRAGPGRCLRGDQMHPTDAIRTPLHPFHGQPVEAEQPRRIVDHARGSRIRLPREQT